MSFINVLFKRVTTAIRGTEAIEDGKILLDYERPSIYVDNGSTRVELTPRDTALSTTSTNAIANNALTNSIINTTAEVNAITADNIPCGTKPVKELISNTTTLYEAKIPTKYQDTPAKTEVTIQYSDLQCKSGKTGLITENNNKFSFTESGLWLVIPKIYSSDTTTVASLNIHSFLNNVEASYFKQGQLQSNQSIVGDKFAIFVNAGDELEFKFSCNIANRLYSDHAPVQFIRLG